MVVKFYFTLIKTSFSSDSQFSIRGYSIIRKDQNENDGGVLFYIDENISFSSDSQFSIRGYPIIRKDRNKNGGEILSYIGEDKPFQEMGCKPPSLNMENFLFI